MSNIIAFRPASTVRELPNPSFDPTELIEMTPRQRKQLGGQEAEPTTETGKNLQLRVQRREAWWHAERQVEYWKACMKMHSAIYSVQRAGLPEGDNHNKVEHWHWHPILDSYRKAVAKLLVTPAPTLLNVAWKKKALAAEKHKFTGVSSDQIEAAIAQDIEFLAAHPTRRKRERSA